MSTDVVSWYIHALYVGWYLGVRSCLDNIQVGMVALTLFLVNRYLKVMSSLKNGLAKHEENHKVYFFTRMNFTSNFS